jgi:hypothetical protein
MTAESIIVGRSTDRAVLTRVAVILSLLAVAIITRAGRIGDPAIHMDEQFYLLVGDRMWHGALPYVAIWDRKPILLFLIYAALRPLSADGIVAYQVGALAFAVATAYVIVLIARRFANQSGAWLAGVAYLLYLPLLSGAGGQSPVFYNLFMALGALEAIRAGESTDAAGVWRCGSRCMMWAGLAIQVKYTAAVEGIGFGLWLITLVIRRNAGVDGRVAGQVALWIATALAPTLLAFGAYVLLGHGQEFVQANFLSILAKRHVADESSLPFLGATLAQLAPLFAVAIPSAIKARREGASGAPWRFLALWIAFAFAGFLVIGNFYDHYALPLLVPLAVLCAPLLGTRVGGTAALALFAWCAVVLAGIATTGSRDADRARIATLVDAARPYAAQGCLYLNDGPPIVYLLTHSCLPTRYVFPSHLNEADEAPATDAARAMAALLASRPSAIFVADKPMNHARNAKTAALLDAALASNYRRVAVLPDVIPQSAQILYVRNDLISSPASHSAAGEGDHP